MKFKAGDRENNWRELLAAAPNADDTLNRWGYDVWAVNHELTGVKESSGALDVLKGRHGMDRVGDSADRGAENVKKALEKAANTVKGAFS